LKITISCYISSKDPSAWGPPGRVPKERAKRQGVFGGSEANPFSLALYAAVSEDICRKLRMNGGKVGDKRAAAWLLRINPLILPSKMRKLGIPFGRKR